MVKIISVGEILWDVFGQSEYLGGAPFNFSVVSHRLGNSVALLTAVGTDERGARILEAMQNIGLTTDFVQTTTERPTGTAIVSVVNNHDTSFKIDRPAAFDCVTVNQALLRRVTRFAPDWLYFGTLSQTNPSMERAILRLAESLPKPRCFYDLNLRTGHWTLALVEKLSSAADVLKLNHHEAALIYELAIAKSGYNLECFCRQWSSRHEISTICVTLGSDGCAIFANDILHTFPGFTVKAVDSVGAGDAFAAAFLHGLCQGWLLEKSATFANALGALVASRSGAVPDWDLKECFDLIRSGELQHEAPNSSEPGSRRDDAD